jgi:hypothetical protein
MLCTNGVAERGFHLLPLSTLSGGCTLEDLQDVPHVQLRGHGPVNLPCLCATTMGTRKSGRRMEWEHSALIGTSWHRQERTVFCFPRNMKREARPEIYEARMLLWRVILARLTPMLVERANARGLHKQTGLLARSTEMYESYLESVEQSCAAQHIGR